MLSDDGVAKSISGVVLCLIIDLAGSIKKEQVHRLAIILVLICPGSIEYQLFNF